MADVTEPLILMIEDDKLLGTIFTQKFASNEMRFIRAASGEEALQLLGEGKRPDLVLLDIHLPGMGGYEFLKKVRDDPATKELPVIVFSNFNSPEDIAQSKALGALRHIQKVTLTPLEVVNAVREELTKLGKS
jgi:CheY-like chemotaxis protein